MIVNQAAALTALTGLA